MISVAPWHGGRGRVMSLSSGYLRDVYKLPMCPDFVVDQRLDLHSRLGFVHDGMPLPLFFFVDLDGAKTSPSPTFRRWVCQLAAAVLFERGVSSLSTRLRATCSSPVLGKKPCMSS